MKRLMPTIAVMAALGILGPNVALAQRGIAWRGAGGWGPGTTFTPGCTIQTPLKRSAARLSRWTESRPRRGCTTVSISS